MQALKNFSKELNNRSNLMKEAGVLLDLWGAAMDATGLNLTDNYDELDALMRDGKSELFKIDAKIDKSDGQIIDSTNRLKELYKKMFVFLSGQDLENAKAIVESPIKFGNFISKATKNLGNKTLK